MRSELDLFTLKHRIFLVKNFYQLNGDCMCVKTKYDCFYRNSSESPAFSSDVLVEIISLFERTGSVFRGPEAVTSLNLQGDCQQIEQIYVKVENPDEDVQEAETMESYDNLQSPVPENSDHIRTFDKYESDVYNSSGENTSDADTLSNEEHPLVMEFKRDEDSVRKQILPEWWENPDDSLELEDIKWNQCTPIDKESDTGNSRKINDLNYFECTDKNCRKTFKSWPAYNLHRLTHSDQKDKIYKCKNCDKIFLHNYALKRHFKSKHMQLQHKCYKCGCSFREEKNYRNHLEEHGQEPQGGQEFYDEPPNSPEFKKPEAPPSKGLITKRKLITSIAVNQKKDVAAEPKTTKKKRIEKFRTCEVCGKVCSTARYRKHTMTHSGERPITCNICGKGYIYSCGYQKHMLRHKGIDTSKKRSVCEFCGKRLTGPKILQEHIRRIHERVDQKFKCKVSGCGRSYPNEKSLRRHMDRHNGRFFKCSSCNMEYKDKYMLKLHMDRVHLKADPPLKCEICGKLDWRIFDHRSHMRICHNIEVPYVRKKPPEKDTQQSTSSQQL
ncbi:zinc finger protein 709-like isoform X1 [Lutzomyia longipalpis]|uniref:zinc finger protein 709-like isoform X1 n=1 Tax=Lutzomyia longipalpis TaxID=7200 RepID=UPI0024837A2C|nr:zinc finger protein 709-like isoform X1 [Lutzomyia longipalpis]